MNWIRPLVSTGKVVPGTWVTSGSSVLAEVAGKVGFDWALIDMEHGMGSLGDMRHMLQAMGSTTCAPVVRIGALDVYQIKRALDWGAAGIMIPMINTPEEAEQAVAAMRYPPEGIRGMTSGSRAAGYGTSFPDYFARANQDLLTVCQIETKQAVENAEAIAAVDGVDVLFIGPSDLTLNLGCYKKLDHPEFRECLQRVVAACRTNGKQGGILLSSPADIPGAIDDGLTFIALGVDIALYREGLKVVRAAFDAAG